MADKVPNIRNAARALRRATNNQWSLRWSKAADCPIIVAWKTRITIEGEIVKNPIEDRFTHAGSFEFPPSFKNI